MSLTVKKLKSALRYSRNTGIFVRIKRTSNNMRIGNIAGCLDKTTGYLRINLYGKQYWAHRLAWYYVTGIWPKNIDHKDGVRSNNKWKNLRNKDQIFNMQNLKKAYSTNISGLLGVSVNGNGFSARIQINGFNRYIGQFKSAKQAHSAYIKVKRQMHSGNTL